MICLMIHGVELIMNAKDIVATDRVTASSTLTFIIKNKNKNLSFCRVGGGGSIILRGGGKRYVAVSFRAMVIALITGGFDEASAVAW